MLGLVFLLRENNEVLIEVLIDIVVDATDKITECQETLYSPNLLNCNFVRSINDNIDENIELLRTKLQNVRKYYIVQIY